MLTLTPGRGFRRMILQPMAGRRGLHLLRTTTAKANSITLRAKMELLMLHYKDKKVFPFEKYVTKLKEQF